MRLIQKMCARCDCQGKGRVGSCCLESMLFYEERESEGRRGDYICCSEIGMRVCLGHGVLFRCFDEDFCTGRSLELNMS